MAKLSDILKELSRQAGYRVALASTEAEWLERTFTINTQGKVPFWEAVNLLCNTVRLEVSSIEPINALPSQPQNPFSSGRGDGLFPQPAMPLGIPPAVEKIQAEIVAKQKGIIDLLQKRAVAATAEEKAALESQIQAEQALIREQMRKMTAAMTGGLNTNSGVEERKSESGAVLLRPRKRETTNVAISSAARLEQVEPNDLQLRSVPTNGRLAVLMVGVEPRLQWERIDSVRIKTAIDNDGHKIEILPNPVNITLAPVASSTGPNGVQIRNPARNNPFAQGLADAQLAVIRLGTTADKIKQVEGTIVGFLRSAPDEIIRIDNLEKVPVPPVAATAQGVTLQIQSLAPASDGLGYTLVIKLAFNPNNVTPIGVMPSGATETVIIQNGGRMVMRQMGGGVIIVNGRAIGDNRPTGRSATTMLGLQLSDASGKSFELTSLKSTRVIEQDAISSTELTLGVRAKEKDQGKPDRLTFSGICSKAVEIPFKMNDVTMTPGTAPVVQQKSK
jgi:hypothetical protein